jgi:putative FmdB family regulatory protein
MPFYEYECQACKFYTEVMQKITEAPLSKCPSCGKRALKKLVSAPVFRLKGAGWYETDFKSEKENKRNLSGIEKEEPKAEAKPAPGEAKPAEAAGTAAKDAKAPPAATAPEKSARSASSRRSAPRQAARRSRARRTRAGRRQR